MASLLPPPSSLQLRSPFPRAKLHAPPKFATRATTDSDAETTTPSSSDQPAGEEDAFEARLNRVKYRSGTGKKAELRKTRKSQSGSSPESAAATLYLPPVALREPKSAVGGMKVEAGMSPYSEKLNGVAAAVGLAALISVELATGKSVFSFHAPAVVFTQLYFVAAAMTLFVKFEKERLSVWPPPKK